jgi:hypothetical protein
MLVTVPCMVRTGKQIESPLDPCLYSFLYTIFDCKLSFAGRPVDLQPLKLPIERRAHVPRPATSPGVVEVSCRLLSGAALMLHSR